MTDRYPSFNFQQPYTYMPPQIAASKPNIDVQEVKDTNILVNNLAENEKTSSLNLMAETLDKPANSLPFLELYHKSAQKVEKLATTLKKLSVSFGFVASFFFVIAMFSLFYHSSQQANQTQSHKNKLRAGTDDLMDSMFDEKSGDLNFKALYGAFSMVIWGLIVAKAKSGYNAATSKDHQTVQSSWKNTLTILVLVAVATFAQMRLENTAAVVTASANSPAKTEKGRKLSSAWQDDSKTDFGELLNESLEMWKQDHLKSKSPNHQKKLSSDAKSAKKIDRVQVEAILKSDEFKSSVKKLGELVTAVIFGIFCVSYVLVFRQYKLAVEKHQQLTDLFNNPNARVASGEKAQQVLENVMKEQEQESIQQKQSEAQKLLQQQPLTNNRLQLLQAMYNQQTPVPLQAQVRIESPTIYNLPPAQKKENTFNYSLCESIDYQRESLLPQQEIEQPKAPQNNFYSIDQVQHLLNQQKAELEKKYAEQQAILKIQGQQAIRVKPQNVHVITQEQFKQLQAASSANPMIPVVQDEENFNGGTMKISSINNIN